MCWLTADSFGMCLLELVDRKLPWTACCPPALVTAKVTQGEMHLLEPQLAQAEAPIAELARECWAREPMERPSFPQIVTRLQQLMGISNGMPSDPASEPVPRPEPPAPPGPPMQGRAFVRRKVEMSTEQDRETWREVQARVAESLPEYSVTRIDRLQNLDLWRHYFLFCFDLESHGEANERTLFHWAKPEVLDLISGERGSGFETRLARPGEYGDGTYFAQHAIYPLAYRTNGCRVNKRTLDWSVPQEPGTQITLLWARVALGKVCNFGARCASRRGDRAARAAGEPAGLHSDWPMDGHATTGHRRRPPPMIKPTWTGRPTARNDVAGHDGQSYDSVSGTEANLEWTQNPHLVENGAEFGKQFVTFNNWQAYPELVIYLEKTCDDIGGSE
eukprot:COSAG01_NODE_2769_length_7102_cov_6.325146_3_plen_390_part_00